MTNKKRPEFEVSANQDKMQRVLREHFFNILWNHDMKRHMKDRLNRKIRFMEIDKAYWKDKGYDIVKVPQQYQLKRFRDCEFFDHFLSQFEVEIGVLDEVRDRADTEYMDSIVKGLFTTKGEELFKRKRNLIKTVSKIQPDFDTRDLKRHKEIEAKFKIKFKESKQFRDLIDRMSEIEKLKFRMKIDANYIRTLIITIHENIILGTLDEVLEKLDNQVGKGLVPIEVEAPEDSAGKKPKSNKRKKST